MLIILIIPSLILISLVFFIPLIRYFWLSTKALSVVTGLNIESNNGANWIRLISDQRFMQDAYQTFRFTICSVGLEIILGIVIALLLNQRLNNRGLVRAITL